MSNTRHAPEGSPLRQERWASIPTPQSLNGSLVALRMENARLRGVEISAEDEVLLWYLQARSMQSGGLPAFAAELLDQNRPEIATAEMLRLGVDEGRFYNAEEVKRVRSRFRDGEFLTQGELSGLEQSEIRLVLLGDIYDGNRGPQLRAEIEAESARRPLGYHAAEFKRGCENVAGREFKEWLLELCLNGEREISKGPWYFPGAIEAIRRSMDAWRQRTESILVETRVVSVMRKTFAETAARRSVTLIESPRSIGASFAARVLCAADPGRMRYVSVPAGNDEESLVRAVMRALGGTDGRNYKVTQLKNVIRKILDATGILLVLDHAQQVWPQTNLRRGHPARMEWVLDLAKNGTPIVFVADQQFTKTLDAVSELLSWNCRLLTDRIGHCETLPGKLDSTEAHALSRAMLPGVTSASVRAVALIVEKSERSFRTLCNIAERARYRAGKADRSELLDKDVKEAIREAVNADANVARLLGSKPDGPSANVPPTHGEAFAEPPPFNRFSPVLETGPELNRLQSIAPVTLEPVRR